MIAAELYTSSQKYGLSVGDRARLALAIDNKTKVYTADKVWKKLKLPIDVVLIR